MLKTVKLNITISNYNWTLYLDISNFRCLVACGFFVCLFVCFFVLIFVFCFFSGARDYGRMIFSKSSPEYMRCSRTRTRHT